MRRTIAALTALLVAVGLTVAVAGPAAADITAPANGAVLRDDATLSSSGGYDDSTLDHCSWFGGSGGDTRIELINSGGTSVVNQFWNTGGARSVDIDTRNYANGNYTVKDTITIRKNSGFLGTGCKNESHSTTRSVSIDNFVTVSYSGATTAPRNTSIPVSATVVDGAGGAPVSGISVTFSLTGGGSVSASTNGSGVASATLPVQGSARTATLTIAASSTTFWRGGSITRSFDVTKNATATTLAPTSAVVHGQPVSFSASVTATNGTGTPTGTVQFTIDGDPLDSPVALVGGNAATPPTTSLSTGTHTVGASYSGDSGFLASSAPARTQVVDKAETTTTLTGAPSPTVSGQAVTFTATVDVVAPGAGAPTGGVQFFVDGDPFGTARPLSGHSATLTISNLGTGNHAIKATYNGDDDFATSTSATFTHGVNRADSTVALSSSDPGAVAGEPLTFTAAVTAVGPGAGTPTGEVQFYVDNDPLGGPVTLDGGTATSPVTHLPAGSHVVAVDYEGDVNFGGASTTLAQIVDPAQTRTVVSSSPSPSVFGQAVTLHAEVSPVAPATGEATGVVEFVVVVAPGAGNPSGAITFKDGTTVLGTVPVDSATGEQASLTTSALAVGQHAIVATYSGDDSFLSSTDSATQKVERAQTSALVTSSANPAKTGQGVRFTAVVTPVAPGAGHPTGTVVFTVNGAPLGSPVAVVDGTATSSAFASLSPGTYAIKATYSGDGNFLGSAGLLDQGTGQAVTKGATTTDLTSGPDPASPGEPVTFTATVSAVAPATGRPSGVVRFWEGSVLLGASSLAPAGASTSAQATFVSSTLAVGPHSIRAEYLGNFNFDGSTATTDQSVDQSGTVTGVESSANPSSFGQTVTLTAVVAATPAAAGDPTGTVTFSEGSTVLGTATLATVGGRQQASVAVPGLPTGAHTIRAAYSGSTTFAASTSAAYVQQVGRAASTIVAGEPHVRGDVTATLTGVGGAPLAGQTVSFYSHPSDNAGQHLCDAVTGADGVASCDETVINLVVGGSFDGGYDARFAGNGDYLPAEDYGQQF
ncbi:MAG: Ig-like domain repeat protein [Propionibacteriales bacterium]|nr:Ig-like domain repeat protein [Propionibacteriales bacterium]